MATLLTGAESRKEVKSRVAFLDSEMSRSYLTKHLKLEEQGPTVLDSEPKILIVCVI